MKQLGDTGVWVQRLTSPYGREVYLLGPSKVFGLSFMNLRRFDLVESSWYCLATNGVKPYLSKAELKQLPQFLDTVEPELVSELPDLSGFVRKWYIG